MGCGSWFTFCRQMNHIKNDGARPSGHKGLLTLAGVLLAIPIGSLLWVGSYARVEPTLAGFPFFIWYQFVWVFVCAACTLAAHHVILIARRRPSGRGPTATGTGR